MPTERNRVRRMAGTPGRVGEAEEQNGPAGAYATAIWNNRALADEEGIQTRCSTYPKHSCLWRGQITRLGNNSARLDLLNGMTLTASGGNWDFAVAKAIHRNLVRVPFWAVTAGLLDRRGG